MTSTMVSSRTNSKHAAASSGELRVQRTDIEFSNRRPDRVDIRVVVTNVGSDKSEPTSAALSAAPLGAFVRWRPLQLIRVPGLEPGESFEIETQARQPRPYLGTPDRVPPRRLLTALGADDNDEPRETTRGGIRARGLLSLLRAASDDKSGLATRDLPANPFDLLSRGNPHWAGNLNIFVGGRAVERHRAQALRVYPERRNMAMFIVGSRRDAYSFHLTGPAQSWDATLYDLSCASSFLAVDQGGIVPVDRWIEMRGHAMMLLAMCPPADCSEETIEVHVKQRSTGETAIVEFSLDPAAAGPGCYVV